jgi:RNA polymerase sigma factor (sigma-70 family)
MPSPQRADVSALIDAARRGDELAWTRLHQEFDVMLRSVAASCRLHSHDIDDAVQHAWIKLHMHVHAIRDPSAIGGWLATTVRRESLRLLQSHVREVLTDEPITVDHSHDDGPETQLIERERQLVLTRALGALPDRHRRLMTLIAADASYEQIAAKLDMPMGSIGPIRSRCLARLHRHAELSSFAEAA